MRVVALQDLPFSLCLSAASGPPYPLRHFDIPLFRGTHSICLNFYEAYNLFIRGSVDSGWEYSFKILFHVSEPFTFFIVFQKRKESYVNGVHFVNPSSLFDTAMYEFIRTKSLKHVPLFLSRPFAARHYDTPFLASCSENPLCCARTIGDVPSDVSL